MDLRNVRKSKNITLDKLSKASSISVSYLSELENDKYEATESKIIRLSLALNVTPNELLGWDKLIDTLKENLKDK